jgi:hypothetical protein
VSATGFVLAVSDQGIGMAPDRIAEANKLLADPPVVGLALSRALGLHVVGSLAQRHAIGVELRPGAPGGIVALVALPTAVLEPRAASAPRAAATGNPIYSPDLDDRGEAEPLGARRMVSRPPDEPPVEEWGWEGLTAGGTAPTEPVDPAAATHDAPTYEAPTYEAPTSEAPVYDVPAYDTPTAEVPAYEAPAAESPTFDIFPPEHEAPVAESPTYDIFPPAYDAPIVDTPTADAQTYDAPTYDAPAYDAPAYDAPAYDAPAYDAPAYDAPAYDAPAQDAPTYDSPTYDAPPPPPPLPDPDEAGFQEAAPLPMRVPGQHLSHHPRLVVDAPDAEADPMRAYRVHELLTRHAQGKRRGQAGDDIPAGTSPVPGAPVVQEDGT